MTLSEIENALIDIALKINVDDVDSFETDTFRNITAIVGEIITIRKARESKLAS